MAYLEYPRSYPQTHLFLIMQLPLVPVTKPSVFEHFRIFSALPEVDAKNLLRQGYEPQIKMRDTGSLYGYTPPTGQEIWLHKGVFSDIEALLSGNSEIVTGYYERQEQRRTNFTKVLPSILPLLEVTVLHELVHYGRKLVHGYNPDLDMEEAIADEFEKQAYGQSHTATSLGISDIIAEPGSPWRR